jgi:REP element-mobilizing transposase RayT
LGNLRGFEGRGFEDRGFADRGFEDRSFEDTSHKEAPMPRRKVQFHPGDVYHIYNRGNNRENIVIERKNYGYFIRLVRRYLLPVVDVLAYCIMPNHYHLLVLVKQTPEVSETSGVSRTVSNAMMRLSVAYTKAINKRYSRVGSLFQRPFRAKPIPSDLLLDVSCYVHHNPVAAGFVEDAVDWDFSSAREYLGVRKGTLPTPGPVLALLPDDTTYAAYLRDYAAWQTERLAELTLE